MILFSGTPLVTTPADKQTLPSVDEVSGPSPELSALEIGLFSGGAFLIILLLIVCAGWYCVRLRKRKKSLELQEVKYNATEESVVIEQPQRFVPRTASVSSTGSAALFMRQRSFRNRLESRLTQVKIGTLTDQVWCREVYIKVGWGMLTALQRPVTRANYSDLQKDFEWSRKWNDLFIASSMPVFMELPVMELIHFSSVTEVSVRHLI